MKYEMIFGDEKLFDGCDENAIAVVDDMTGVRKSSKIEFFSDDALNFETVDIDSRRFKLAMRRIIKEPKHWTVADQKAGRLPEVGSKYLGKNELNPEAELICDLIDGDECVWGHDKNKKMLCFYASNIKPIETPDEKSQREEDEFVKSEMKDTTLSIEWACIYERGVRAAYRKLKGGE